MSNLTGGLFKALVHFHLGAHLVGQFYGQMKCLRLALPQNRQEKLAMELLAVGASAVGLAALAAAFDERAGKHLAPRAQSANQPAAQGEIGGVGHLTLIIVSELGEVKVLREFARMTGKLSRLWQQVGRLDPQSQTPPFCNKVPHRWFLLRKIF